ncbi:type 2 periplasmic-binding domain-containing protein [Paraburkholderia sediminicola]|uniref:hypothetical protein n=1 Tax=Paraburkholderia sediminicola TaxID=458836 RepID=UPI0038BD3498
MIGGTFEWFDFMVYSYFSSTIARVFFPSFDRSGSLLLTFGTFAVGFLARPIGGVVMGMVAGRPSYSPPASRACALKVGAACIKRKRLVPILTRWRLNPFDVYIAYPLSRRYGTKVRVFADWAATLFASA